MIWIIAVLILWAIVAQFIAWLICGNDADDDQIIGIWAGVFIFIPLLPLYAIIYVLRFIVNHFGLERKQIDIVEDVL